MEEHLHNFVLIFLLRKETSWTKLFFFCIYNVFHYFYDNRKKLTTYSLERAAAGIGLYVNAHKTEYICAIIKQVTSH